MNIPGNNTRKGKCTVESNFLHFLRKHKTIGCATILTIKHTNKLKLARQGIGRRMVVSPQADVVDKRKSLQKI
jgi:hypothetical protein